MDYFWLRQRMVEEQLISRVIKDPRVLEAFRKVPREEFVPSFAKSSAYIDAPLSIGEGQTISQPYTVALMTELLELEEHSKVLEVGTGSGYQAAILAELVERVYSIERIPELAEVAKDTLTRLGYTNDVAAGHAPLPEKATRPTSPSPFAKATRGGRLRGAGALQLQRARQKMCESSGNVKIKFGDGSQGWPEEAPFDGIIVTAAAPQVPVPLLKQLADGGRLVAPIGGQLLQEMVRFTKRGRGFKKETFGNFRFVPLVSD